MPQDKDGNHDEPEGQSNMQTETTQEKESAPKREPINVTVTDIELEELKHEAQEYKDKYLLVLAESENARKRLMKERQEMIQYTLSNLICDFLGPIDQMENALKHTENASGEVKQWSIGFEMILTHFKDVLANNNVHAFSSVGKAFDPHLHEAIEMVTTTEHPSGIVVEENLQGYKMGDRVIRPARVKVAKSPDENNNNGNEAEESEEQEK